MHTTDGLKVEIDRELNGLKNLEVGSDQLSSAVNDVTKLYDRLIEAERVESEAYEKAETRKAERLNRWINLGVTVGTTLLTTGVTLLCFHRSMKFEETGTITTFAGRLMQGRALGKK